jgi:hypothetical protein
MQNLQPGYYLTYPGMDQSELVFGHHHYQTFKEAIHCNNEIIINSTGREQSQSILKLVVSAACHNLF